MCITPPGIKDLHPTFSQRLAKAVHVLNTEATALSYLTRLYETDPIARSGFDSAVGAITRFQGEKGKLVIAGVGKSGHIAKKLVATMNSLGIHATYLHPTEALHGDLGKVNRKHDTILLITFSGKTPELLTLLPHFYTLPVIVLTSHTRHSTCEIIKQRPDTILLPAPIHESEIASFGCSAPTTSTTMALAVGDALAVAISHEYYPSVAAVFSLHHPGGAIGAALKGPQKISDLAIAIPKIWEVIGDSVTAAHVLLAAYQSKTGWVRRGNDMVVPPRRIKRLLPSEMDESAICIEGLMVARIEWISIQADISLAEAVVQIKTSRRTVPGGEIKYGDDAILAAMVDGEVTGVMEVAELFS